MNRVISITAGFALLSLMSFASAPTPPDPTEPGHAHSKFQLALDPKFKAEARYCDEENAFVKCFHLMKGTKQVDLTGVGVSHVYLYGKEITPADYSITMNPTPIPYTPGSHIEAVYDYHTRLVLTKPAKRDGYLEVIYYGSENSHPHHPEDNKPK